MFCSLYKHQFDFFFFFWGGGGGGGTKGATYYNVVTIAKEVFSHVKKKM